MTFFLSLLFVFLVFWRPQEWLWPWLFGWPILDIVVYTALLSFLVEISQGLLRFPKKAQQLYLLIGLWLATLMSHVANTYYVGLIETIPESFKICLFTLLLFSVLDRPSRLRAVAGLFVAMACFMAIHALLQQERYFGFAGQPPIPGRLPQEVRSRFFGIFDDPNDLAQMLATSIPFAFGLFRRRSLLSVAVGCAVTWLLVKGIVATDSRGGYIALATVSAIMVVLALPTRWFPALMLALLIGALVFCPLAVVYLDPSAQERVVFWGMANRVFKASPVFGIGYGMFWQVARDRAAHNAFVSCYTTLGFFGYWFWFGLLQLSVVCAWRARMVFNRPENEEQAWLKRFSGLCIVAMGGYCASAYFLSRDFVYPIFFLFALLGSLAVVAQKLLPEGHPPLIGTQKHVWVMGTVGAFVSIVYVYFSIVLLNKAFYGG